MTENKTEIAEDKIEWQGQVENVNASELKAGVIYIDRNKANFSGPETERKLKIVEMNLLSEENGYKYYELVAETEDGKTVHPKIGFNAETSFDVIRKTD